MYCPTCGSKQSDERKFCTSCGTNIQIVSQALTGQVQRPLHMQANYQPPQSQNPAGLAVELERQREVAKGFRFAIIGGGIIAFKLFSFVFAGPFRGGSPFGFWSIIGFILLAVGVSKIIGHRQPSELPAQPQTAVEGQSRHHRTPQPIFSSAAGSTDARPQANYHQSSQFPAPSVTEDETLHLQERPPQQPAQRSTRSNLPQ